MPKKQRNAFYFFMLDKQQQLREQGKVVSLKDMPVIASAEWNKLPEAQKEQYKLRAKHERATGSGAAGVNPLPRPGRLDNTGIPLSDRVDVVAELEERRRVERELLKKEWHGKDVIFLKFYFIAFQYLCHVEDVDRPLRYPPVEMALMEYSLKEGRQKVWHTLIHPGKVPTGFRYQAKLHAEQTHEIPPEGIDKQSVSDYRALVDGMMKFVSHDHMEFPPLFVKKESAFIAECCLQWLSYMAGLRENPFCKVYELNGLFMDLSAHIGGAGLSRFEVSDLLSTFKYDHELGLRCSYHEDLENNNCALGEVNKYCFVMSDTLCPLYKVSLTKNHLPLEASTGIGDMLPLKPLSTKDTRQEDKLHHKPQGVQLGAAARPIGRGRGILCLNAEDIRKPH